MTTIYALIGLQSAPKHGTVTRGLKNLAVFVHGIKPAAFQGALRKCKSTVFFFDMIAFLEAHRVEIGLAILLVLLVKTTNAYPASEPYWAIVGYFTIGFLDYWYIARHERVDQLPKRG